MHLLKSVVISEYWFTFRTNHAFILFKATKDKCNIWGIIKTGINQDGRTATPMTAPSSEQQQQLLFDVYKKYNVHPRNLQYIEVHGEHTNAKYMIF